MISRYFQYDSVDRLTQEAYGSITNTFGYDSAGNPTTMRGGTQTFNSKNHLTITGYSYDADGNPTTYSGTNMTFNPENHLVASGSSWTAGYNGEGLQAWRNDGTSTTYTLYDGEDPVVELDGTGTASAVNTFGENGLISRDGTQYTFDWRGGISQRLDSTQAVLTSFLNDAFGQSFASTTSDPFATFGAQAGYYNDGSGYQRLGFRHYDGFAGRFLTEDPSGDEPNLYSYVDNDPTTMIDPEGLFGLNAKPGHHRKKHKKRTNKLPLPPATKSSGIPGQLDIDLAVWFLDTYYRDRQGSGAHCAHAIRTALEYGMGDTDGYPVPAYEYGPTLRQIGYRPITGPESSYGPQKGDVVVFKPWWAKKYHPYGHIEMYDGKVWISDWGQATEWPHYPHPDHTIYRFEGTRIN